MSSKETNPCVVPGFGTTEESNTRYCKRTWEERGGNHNDIILTYHYDEYTNPVWVIEKVRREIENYCIDFNKKAGENLFEDPTVFGNFSKAIAGWQDCANFSTKKFAEVRVILCVNTKRSSLTHVRHYLGVYWDMNTISKTIQALSQIESD